MPRKQSIKRFVNSGIKNMKLKNLVESAESLRYLMNLKLPVVLSYKLSLLAKKSNPELETYDTKRNELLKELADPVIDDDGKDTGNMKFKTDNDVKKYNEEIKNLLDQDVNIEVPEVKIDEFKDISIEPKHLVALDWLIKE